MAPNASRQVHAITRTVFRSAVADELIPETPFDKIALPKVARGEVRPPTVDQVHALVEAAPTRLQALVVLAAGSGLRSGELLGLTVDPVDFLRREVRVDQQLVYVPGQPAPRPAEDAEVPTDRAAPGVRRRRRRAASRCVPRWRGRAGLQADKGGPVLRTTFAGRWQWTLKRAGLPTTVHLHHLRHSYASLLNGAGVPFTTVMELLCLAPQGVTWSTYTHRIDGWDRQVRTVLDEAWRGSADYLRTERAD